METAPLTLRNLQHWFLLLFLVCLSLGSIPTFFNPMGFLPHSGLTFYPRVLGCIFIFLWGLARKNLSTWIWVGLVIGLEMGIDFPLLAHNLHVLGDIFLRLVKTLLAPLLFATLVYGIAGHSNLKQVGRMGLKALIYFEVVTTFALIIGVMSIHFTHAGLGIPRPAHIEKTVIPPAMPLADTIAHIFPENIAKSVAEGQILQVVIFSIFFGIGLAMVPDQHKKPLIDLSKSLSEVMFRFTSLVMNMAPIAVGSAMAYTVSTMGLGILQNLMILLLTFFGAIFIFILLILLPIALLAKIPLKRFAGAILEPVSIAFATASSEAALPKAMAAMEELGASRHVVSFVMPAGYSFNMDGGTLYLSLASIFIAQASGKSLSLSQEFLMILTLMLASKGIAGVPRAALTILAGMSASLGLASWPIFILFGIDGILDMGRSALNVLGNCLATVVIARSENEFSPIEKLTSPKF